MSDEKKPDQKNGGSPGKSLAVMQERLLSKTSSEETKEATTAAPAAAAQPQGRSKGKDFASMARNAPKAAPAPAAVPPGTQPIATSKPKGKDFAAMANRMPTAHTGTVHPQDPDRAAKMQAAARAAAGLPPLTQPTATTVTVAPPPIQASVPPPAQRPAAPPAVPPQAYRAPHPQAMQVPPQATQVDPRHHPTMPMTTQMPPSKGITRATSAGSHPVAAVRRNSGTQQPVPKVPAPPMAVAAAPVAPAAPPKPKPASNKLTPQPTAVEWRVSAHAGRTAGPQNSPLVGQRLRDLLASLDPNYVLDAEAEEQVLQLADDFLDKVTKQSLRLAQHRGSKTLDVQDVQLALQKQWGIVVPGLGPPNLVRPPAKPANRTSASAATKRRSSSAESSKAAKKPKTGATTNTADAGRTASS